MVVFPFRFLPSTCTVLVGCCIFVVLAVHMNKLARNRTALVRIVQVDATCKGHAAVEESLLHERPHTHVWHDHIHQRIRAVARAVHRSESEVVNKGGTDPEPRHIHAAFDALEGGTHPLGKAGPHYGLWSKRAHNRFLHWVVASPAGRSDGAALHISYFANGSCWSHDHTRRGLRSCTGRSETAFDFPGVDLCDVEAQISAEEHLHQARDCGVDLRI